MNDCASKTFLPRNMMIPVLNQIYDRRYPSRFMINVTGPLAVAGIK